MSYISLIVALVAVMNPFGNIPIIIQQTQEIPKARIKWIITREMIFSTIILLIFGYIGKPLLQFMGIDIDTLKITGGIILFVIGMHLIFPQAKEEKNQMEPFIVPIAFPIVSGPGAISVIIAHNAHIKISDFFEITICVIAVCTFVLLVFLLSSLIIRLIGNQGLLALRKFGGILIMLIATQMLIEGAKDYFVL